MKFPVKYRILIGLSLGTVLLDQFSKRWILSEYRLGETTPLFPGFFNVTYIRNTGAAFGIMAQTNPAFRIPFFTIVPLVALGAIVYVFKRVPEGDRRLSAALSLVIGGAVGNLIDRAVCGYVIDFLDFHWHSMYHFPAFNVADSAICVGVGILMIDLLLRDRLGNAEAGTEETRFNASSTF